MNYQELPIVSRTASWVAIEKPAGLLVHPTELTSERDSVMTRLRQQLGQKVYPVHRLDRAASGILLVSLSSKAASGLAQQFRNRVVSKEYGVVVRGWLPECGVIEKPLAKSPRHDPRPAWTEFHRLAQAELPVAVLPYDTSRYSFARVKLRTGRLHQIRRHLVHLRHPVIGDTVYGDGKHNRLFRQELGVSALLLHGWWLGFQDPTTQHPVRVEASWPAAFKRVFEKLGWDLPLA